MLGRTLTQQNVHKAARFLKVLLGSAFEVAVVHDGLRLRRQIGWVDKKRGTRVLEEFLIGWGKKIRDVRTEGSAD